MHHETHLSDARGLMIDFAVRTGLSPPLHRPRRYLWTDAHAVCNFLSLYRQTGDIEYRRLAEQLIEQVHNVLGKHRADDARQGWISGLDDVEGRQHPTAGGLRIGKPNKERGPDEPYDERLEWDRDGQYFHYLTKWMHALCRMSVVTGQSHYRRWAVELAKAAQAGFARELAPGERPRLVWKMSIDLSYPLVWATGLHDPLDGYITYSELALSREASAGLPDLSGEIAATAAMNDGLVWETDDALGIGGLLFDACRALQLTAAGHFETPQLVATLLRDIKNSVDRYARHAPLQHPVQYRLAFRELGLAIGLRALAPMQTVAASYQGAAARDLLQDIAELEQYVPLGREIEAFWRTPENQSVSSWLEHEDINSVMLATRLLPDEFLAV